jgi:hypothetical protein
MRLVVARFVQNSPSERIDAFDETFGDGILCRARERGRDGREASSKTLGIAPKRSEIGARKDRHLSHLDAAVAIEPRREADRHCAPFHEEERGDLEAQKQFEIVGR